MRTSSKSPLMTALFASLLLIAILLAIAVGAKLGKTKTSPQVQESLNAQETPSVEETQKEKDEPAPVFFSIMTHLEGNWTQAIDFEPFFDRQAEYLRQGYAYAQTYNAILTIESEIPMAEAMVKWNDNLLQEALDLGQGVGTHCDITPSEKYSTEEIIEEFARRKRAVDVLVDPSENLGCSGGGGVSDWYLGAVGAGFDYIDGTVGFHLLAVPVRERPQGWDNRAILSEYYHYGVPREDQKKYYPFFISNVGFEEDPSGALLVSAGDIGAIQAIAELEGKEGWDGDCEGECEFSREDVDVLVERIQTLVDDRDETRVMKLQVYIATQYYADPDMEYFFQEMEKLQDEQVFQWASQKQVYEAVVDWDDRS
ncbi:hypothetical protein HQ487_01390 [Candidatus Uhrbacteria bacterium]|nr:hypothetical protein [Candidatus Uhrbacteria bacterium]